MALELRSDRAARHFGDGSFIWVGCCAAVVGNDRRHLLRRNGIGRAGNVISVSLRIYYRCWGARSSSHRARARCVCASLALCRNVTVVSRWNRSFGNREWDTEIRK